MSITWDNSGWAYEKGPCSRSNCEINPCSGHCKVRRPEHDRPPPVVTSCVNGPHSQKYTLEWPQAGDYIEGVNIHRLRAAMTHLGLACGDSHEHVAASMADYINRLTQAVVSPRIPAAPAPVAQHVRCIGRGDTGCGHVGGKSGDTCPSCGGMLLSCEAQIKALKAIANAPAPVALTPAQQHADELLAALQQATPEEPMSQDEQGGCVWCGGTPPGEKYGYAGPDPSHHEPDCAWLNGRQLIAKIEATGQEGGRSMTRDDIIRMAREADPLTEDGWLYRIAALTPETLERFAALVLDAHAPVAQPLTDEQILARGPAGITKHSYLRGWRDCEAAGQEGGAA